MRLILTIKEGGGRGKREREGRGSEGKGDFREKGRVRKKEEIKKLFQLAILFAALVADSLVPLV